MTNKVVNSILAAIVMVGASAGLAQAYDRHNYNDSGLQLSINNDGTTVYNYAIAEAETGDNDQSLFSSREREHNIFRLSTGATQMIGTGDANADALSDAVVNQTYLEVGCDCLDGGRRGSEAKVEVENEDTFLHNESQAEAETGDNDQEIFGTRRSGSQTTWTGSAGALSTTLARVNMTDLRIAR